MASVAKTSAHQSRGRDGNVGKPKEYQESRWADSAAGG
jgi:hypothetical protein